MPFGVVSGVGRGMRVVTSNGRSSFRVNVGRPVETNGDFVTYNFVRERRALPKLLCEESCLLLAESITDQWTA